MRKRFKKFVDRMAQPAFFLGVHERKNTVLYQQRLCRNDDINIVGFDPHAFLDLNQRHFRFTLQQLGQKAFACRVEMLNNNESHAAIGWHLT